MKGNLQQRRGLNQLAHLAIMANLDKDDRDIEERLNAPIMVLRSGTPISEISGRDLPSPADIKGENNVLLLPYYQEVEKKEGGGGGSSMLSLGSDSHHNNLNNSSMKNITP